MQNYTGIPLIPHRTENLAVIGLLVVPALAAKITAIILLAGFGLLHTMGYRRASRSRELHFYFALQTLLVTSLTWLAGPSDAFTFLFFIVGVQAMIVLPPRWGLVWIGLFFLIDSTAGITQRDLDSVIEALFNIAVYIFTALFGYAIQPAESSRRRNQQLLADLQTAPH